MICTRATRKRKSEFQPTPVMLCPFPRSLPLPSQGKAQAPVVEGSCADAIPLATLHMPCPLGKCCCSPARPAFLTGLSLHWEQSWDAAQSVWLLQLQALPSPLSITAWQSWPSHMLHRTQAHCEVITPAHTGYAPTSASAYSSPFPRPQGSTSLTTGLTLLAPISVGQGMPLGCQGYCHVCHYTHTPQYHILHPPPQADTAYVSRPDGGAEQKCCPILYQLLGTAGRAEQARSPQLMLLPQDGRTNTQ